MPVKREGKTQLQKVKEMCEAEQKDLCERLQFIKGDDGSVTMTSLRGWADSNEHKRKYGKLRQGSVGEIEVTGRRKTNQ
jgi:hypothetical protein